MQQIESVIVLRVIYDSHNAQDKRDFTIKIKIWTLGVMKSNPKLVWKEKAQKMEFEKRINEIKLLRLSFTTSQRDQINLEFIFLQFDLNNKILSLKSTDFELKKTISH